MSKAVFSGSFDPFTLGHLDILKRSLSAFDEIHVVVSDSADKRYCFNQHERVEMIEAAIAECNLQNVMVCAHEGFLTDYMREQGIANIVRGLRNPTDFSYEQAMEQLNKHLLPEAEVFYIIASPDCACISSSAVREIASLGGKINGLVPYINITKIAERLIKR